MVLLIGAAQKLTAFLFIGRTGDGEIRDAAQIGDVICAGMGRAIGAHQPGPVEREHHRQLLDRHIVDQLVVGALQKRGIDRHHRLETFAGKASGEGDGMLFGNSDVEIPLRKTLLELHQSRALAHRRRDADQALVVFGHIAQPLAEDLGEGRFCRRRRYLQANRRVELAWAVISHRIRLGQLVSLTLFCHHMQELRTARRRRFSSVGTSESRSWPSIGPV